MDIVKKPLRLLFILAGFLSLGLGIIGIVLPVIPTTPLLLLASYCFMRGSKKFEAWFKESRLYKKHLEGFVKKREMTLKQKLSVLLFADCMIAIPFIMTDSWILRAGLAAVVLYKYYYFFTKIKTIE
ncbi:YbaN family protein [Neobacillus sp. YIM B06451]|uniref:YbaN family protein n=1 Tax=Neobacillus sp. YIM B06451 TaxID=3070994 RepID=UPI00292E4ADA|nr:YbaN family protein [Neobacillus sp. YIM B06451]